MSTFKLSTLLTSNRIRPRKGTISFGFAEGQNQVSDITANSIRYLFESVIDPFVKVRFVEKKRNANINFQLHDFRQFYAYATPDGNIYLNRSNDNRWDTNGWQSALGSHGFATLVHETLHALGLKHPGNYNGGEGGKGPFLPYDLDNNTNTIMSYNAPGSGASTLMPFDIVALQSLYGKKTINAGRTTYKFDSVYSFSDGKRSWGFRGAASKLTLVDDGGYDTVDLRDVGYRRSGGYLFDASAGGILTSANGYNRFRYQPKDARRNTPWQMTSGYGTRLGEGTQIERIHGTTSQDAIYAGAQTRWIDGWSGDDLIVGSDGADMLWGNTGNDEIYGGKGNDQLIGGWGGRKETDLGARDLLYGGEGKDKLYGEGGDDALYGQEDDDIIYGGTGDDYIAGTSEARTRDRDTLYGGAGRDYFVLGEKKDAFYQGRGYAIIKDWEAGLDKLQIGRGGGSYTFEFKKQSGRRLLDGVVYYNNDLIGVVEDIGDNGLSQSDFVFG